MHSVAASRAFACVVLMLTLPFASAQPFGLTNRVANNTIRFPPGLPGIRLTNAFPSLSVNGPIALATPPGETNRLFILERAGRVVVITNLANPTRTVFMDISTRVLTSSEEGLLGIAFHPGYATNRYFFLFYSLSTTTADGTGRHQRISRFETSPSNPNVGMTNTELRLITQFDQAGNHNGGDLHFDPDGYLYITVGDEGDQNDARQNSQRITKDFFSAILRIDVDKYSTNLPPNSHNALMGATNYFVPADNPFIGATQFNGLAVDPTRVRTEFWAVGLRNPWRISFDPLTGVLYCGDVGGSAREEVDVIVKGGNYGWNYVEGTLVRTNPLPAGFSSLPPIAEYPHGTGINQGNSITGGRVYRGSNYPDLYGKYVFADYGQGSGSGSIWTLTPNGTNPVPFQYVATDVGIVAFGVDPRNGDLLLADIIENQIKRLVSYQFPLTLADGGVFEDLVTLSPQSGVVPYDLNVPAWADGADITRWFSVPSTNARITYRQSHMSPFNPWSFPSPTVWIQHFDMEMTNGVPESRRRIETRALVRYTDGINSGAYGLSYRWDSSQTNAVLVADSGAMDTLAIHDGGTTRTQSWRYPSRADCLSCHRSQIGFAAGFNTPQLNRQFDYGGVVDNQLRALHNAGYFALGTPSVMTDFHSLPALARLHDETFSVEHRVRSYLMANCASCHLPPPSTNFDARIYRALSDVNIVNGTATNNLGNPNNRIVKPGSLAESVLLTRLAATNSLRMPPLATTTPDTEAIALVSRWITNDLPNYRTFAQWQLIHFSATNAPEAAASADPDSDRASNGLEWLTGTDPNDAQSHWGGLNIVESGSDVQITYERVANRGFELQYNTNITNATGWRFLDVPQNRRFFAATNGPAMVPDASTSPFKFYRARVYEP